MAYQVEVLTWVLQCLIIFPPVSLAESLSGRLSFCYLNMSSENGLMFGVHGHIAGVRNLEHDVRSEEKHGESKLPEYLKLKLKARGILKDEQAKVNAAHSSSAC